MRTALSLGANNWNGGELYGPPTANSLHLLSAYFTKYPDDAEKVVLSIKGGLLPGKLQPDGSRANVHRSIEECLKHLDGKKSLDLFECARVDPNVPIEETISYIAEYVKAGKVGGISLSEVGAASIRKAHGVHPIAAVEVEYSLFVPDILDNGVAATCAELGIPIVAYSPLGRGFLVSAITLIIQIHADKVPKTGRFQSFDDLEPDSVLRHLPRYQPDVFAENLKLVHAVEGLAKKKGVTSAQIALGWILYQSGKDGMPIIIPIPGATTPERIEENLKPAKLDAEDMKVLDEIIKNFPPTGARYDEAHMKLAWA